MDFCGYAAAGAFRPNRRPETSSLVFFDNIFYNIEENAEEIINNDNEQKIIDEELPYYQGVPIIHFSSEELSSFSINGKIFLEDDASINTLKHEYGHILQEREMGTGLYVVAVAIPSVTCYFMSKNNEFLETNYYNMPWEYDADRRGRVYGRDGYYAEWAEEASQKYFSGWGM